MKHYKMWCCCKSSLKASLLRQNYTILWNLLMCIFRACRLLHVFWQMSQRNVFPAFSWISRIWTTNASLLEKLLPQERQRCPPGTGNEITIWQFMRVKHCFYGMCSCAVSDHLNFLTVYHNIHNHIVSPCFHECLVYEFLKLHFLKTFSHR